MRQSKQIYIFICDGCDKRVEQEAGQLPKKWKKNDKGHFCSEQCYIKFVDDKHKEDKEKNNPFKK